MSSLFAPSIYRLVISCICVSSWHRCTGPEDFEETLWRYTILSCDNKKNTQRHRMQIYLIFFPLSVIQTGFVETLKPQFVPGQVMAGSAAAANLVEEKLSHLQLVQENDNLKSQVNFFCELSS